MIQQYGRTTALAGFYRTHHTRSPGADDYDVHIVVGLFHRTLNQAARGEFSVL
jgi:hypothetical protein